MGPAVIIEILLLLLTPLSFILIGQNVELLIQRVLKTPTELVWPSHAARMVVGAIVYSMGCFILKSTGLPWSFASLLPLLLGLASSKRLVALFQARTKFASVNFVLWLIVVLGTGLSLFQVGPEGISTPWRNNYGDLAYHLGMITSFSLGDNIPPQYHLMAGERLTYPFLVNLWTSALWWGAPSFKALLPVFTQQWVLLWVAIYFLLNGNRYVFLPWALLLGGGSYYTLSLTSQDIIDHNKAWTIFLSSIWVTQRTALFGMAAALSVMQLLFLHGRSLWTKAKRAPLVGCTLLLGLMPLVHTHAFIVTALFVGLVGLSEIVHFWRARQGHTEGTLREGVVALTIVVAGATLLLIPVLPWVAGKAGAGGGMGRIMFGWATGSAYKGYQWSNLYPFPSDAWHQLSLSFQMWSHAIYVWAFLFVALGILTRQYRYFFALFALWILGNVVQLAFWEWDQIKIFITLYAIFLAFWASRAEKSVWALQIFCVFLIHPAASECLSLLKNGELDTIYSATDVDHAIAVRLHTDPHAIVQGYPNHNSALTLTGRKMFMGYEGTLSSHGLKYLPRKEIVDDLEKLAHCRSLYVDDPAACPRYLFWSDLEKQKYGRQKPGPNFVLAGDSVLYEIKEK